MPAPTLASLLTAAVFVGVVVVVIVGGYFATEWIGGAGSAKHRTYMASCIEHHRADRCTEFWTYGRTDLGLKAARK